MRRVVRVTLDLVGLRDPEPSYALVVGEQVRSASWRPVCDLNIGEFVRQDDMSLALQILEDVFAAAVGRTAGITQELVF